MKRVISIVIFAVCSGVWVNAQTIADIARQERAKRQASQKAVVINNSNLRIKPSESAQGQGAAEVKAAPSATPAATPAATAPAAGAAAAPAAAPVRDEKWWRGEFETARTEVRRAENQVAVAELNLNEANRDLLTRSFDPDGRGPAAVAAATARLEDAKKSLTAARNKVTQLEESLRQAGAPAGWAR